MLNRYPLWKYLLILSLLLLGVVYSLANIYSPDPAIQVSGASARVDLGERAKKIAERALDEGKIAHKSIELEDKTLLIRLEDKAQQLKAKESVQSALGDDYVVALSLAPTTPDWLRALGAKPMKLGLDLSGGVHFLLEVDTSVVLEGRLSQARETFRSYLSKNRIRYDEVVVEGDNLVARFDTEEDQDQADDAFNTPDMINLQVTRTEENGQFVTSILLPDSEADRLISEAIDQNLVALRNRVNSTGVSEALIQRQGSDRIVVELPGVQDTTQTKRLIGKTANLEFRLEANAGDLSDRFEFRESEASGPRPPVNLDRNVMVKGDGVSFASVGIDPENGRPMVSIQLKSDAGIKMYNVTSDNIGRNMGVLFIEYNTITMDENGNKLKEPIQEISKKVISLATIQGAFGSQFNVTGLDSAAEAQELALLLKSGALAAPVRFVQENTIGPSLGAANIQQGLMSVVTGFGLVLLFMLVFYKVFGFAANIALTVNLILLTAIMSLLGATLTLPGIAGIVLTVGMAVDANVLIFSRIKEELKSGLSPQAAINTGFDRAFTTILDANITTLIVAVILFIIGSGPVKGFAVTLSIGILTSMFTAIMVTRAIVNLIYGQRSVKKLMI